LFVLGARFLLPALLPQIKQTFGIGNAEGGIAISILWGLYALVQLPAGVLIDRHGERRLLTASLIASGGAVGLLGLAPAFWIFLVGCAIFGFGSGLFGPPRGTVLSRAFPANDNAAIGLTLASGSLGSAVLLFGAGRLVGLVDLSGIMLALVCPFVVLAGLIWWAVPARTDEPQAVPDDSDTITGDIRRALGYPSVVGAAIGVALSLFVLQGLTSFLPTYLVENRVYSEETATALFAAVFVSGAVTRLIGGIIADRTDERVVLVGWGILGTVALGSLPLVTGLVPIAAVLVIVGGALFGLTPCIERVHHRFPTGRYHWGGVGDAPNGIFSHRGRRLHSRGGSRRPRVPQRIVLGTVRDRGHRHPGVRDAVIPWSGRWLLMTAQSGVDRKVTGTWLIATEVDCRR
jgi:predicted MFS family arabinose efflux permease